MIQKSNDRENKKPPISVQQQNKTKGIGDSGFPWTLKKTTWATNTIDQNWEPDCLNTQQYPSPFFIEPRTPN